MINFFEYIVNAFKFLFDALLKFPIWILETFFNLLIDFINFVIFVVGSFIGTIINFLPSSPFDDIFNYLDIGGIYFLGYLDWLVPLDFILKVSSLFFSSILIYYSYVVLLRLFKLKS